MLVFLDLDGVLRRDGSALYQLQSDLLRNFEDTLGFLPEAAIVITSSWREGFSMAEIKSRFSEALCRRIIGATPIDRRVDGHRRYREVRAFRAAHPRPDRPWVAIDDDPEHYPPRENVLLVDPADGFDLAAAARLLLAAGFGPFTRPRSATESELEAAAMRPMPPTEVAIECHLSAPPPLVDKAMRALWDHDEELPGPVAAPEGRWRTHEEQLSVFKAWWLRQRSRREEAERRDLEQE